jgi:hypothetical protein
VRLQPYSDTLTDVKGLLAHCPALRVLDCTEWGIDPRGLPGRGLHSFTFQLNLCRVRHKITPYEPYTPP